MTRRASFKGGMCPSIFFVEKGHLSFNMGALGKKNVPNRTNWLQKIDFFPSTSEGAYPPQTSPVPTPQVPKFC